MKVAVFLVLVNCCDKILWPKPTWGAKIFFHFTRFTSHSTTEESHGKNSSKRWTWLKIWSRSHGGILFIGLLLMTSTTCFLVSPRDGHLLWSEITHINHYLRKMPCGSTYRQSDVGIISIEVLFPRKVQLVSSWHKTNLKQDERLQP